MNPVIRDLLQNIERLGRELERQPRNQPGQTTHDSETTVTRETEARQAEAVSASTSVEEEVARSFGRNSRCSQASSFPSTSHSGSDGTPRFRLAYNFSRSTDRGQNPGKKGKRPTKTPSGSFVKDVILLSGPDDNKVPRQGARVWLMGNGHVVSGAHFQKEWDGNTVHDFLKSLFPEKLGEFDDVEVVMSVHSSLMAPVLAPGQVLSGFMLQKVFKDKAVYLKPMRRILDMDPSFEPSLKKTKYNSEDDELTDNDTTLMENMLESTKASTTSSKEPLPTVLTVEEPEQELIIEPHQSVPQTPSSASTALPPAVVVLDEHSQNEADPDPRLHQTPPLGVASLESAVNSCIDYCLERGVENPVEILRCAQRFLLVGRPLDVTDPSEPLEGDTNFILVNREDIFQSAKEEFEVVENPRLTLEVSFYGEGAVDAGGPRREFFQLCLQQIKRDFFDHGLKEHLSADYVFAGIIMALSVLQNGNIPRFLSEEYLQELFGSGEPSHECIGKLRSGFQKVGIYQIGNALPTFLHLFRASHPSMLSRRKLISLLAPKFSEEGSNARRDENVTYQAFFRYCQQAGSGLRESVTLNHILQFVSGTDEEPCMGFNISPSIQFITATDSRVWCFLPIANTCSNILHLPRCFSGQASLPNDKELFEIYDCAFSSAFFGKK